NPAASWHSTKPYAASALLGWSLLELKHVPLGVNAIAAFDAMELPLLLRAVQLAAETLCCLSCVLNAAYVEKELDRRVLAFPWRRIDCDVRRDVFRYLQDHELKGGSLEQHILFIRFTLLQPGHMFVKTR